MRLAGMCHAWNMSKYSNMGASGKNLYTAKSDVLKWLNAIWNEFSAETIKNSFGKCGFTDDVNCSIDGALEMI